MAVKKMVKKTTSKKNTKTKSKAAIRPEIVDADTPFIDSSEAHAADIGFENSQLPATRQNLTPATQNLLNRYLNEIRKYPVLSREDERRIAQKFFDTKDPAAGEMLVKSNLRFVVKIAAEYARFSNRMIDLIQEGNIGLMQAVKDYNPYKGNRLITYAVWWIRGYIQEYLMKQFSLVRIGTTANQRKLFYELQRQKSELEKMSSPEKVKELSHQLGIPQDEVEEMVKRFSSRDVSIDKPVSDEENAVSLGSLLKKEDPGLSIDEQLSLNQQIQRLKMAIEKIRPDLNDKEKIILEERVLNDEPLTLQEIGEKYKITREAVRQNEVRLINKIKTAILDSL